jgi:steroid delta-isomerase-like uncharacterized protein
VTRPQQIAERWLEAFNAHDEEALRAPYADDAILEAPGDVRLEGADATVEYAMTWLRAFPDARIKIETGIAQGEWVVQRFLFEGTHEGVLPGPMGDIGPTGRQLVGRGVQVIRIQGGEITENYLYFDQVQVLTQLGSMPELLAGRR